MSQRLRRLTVAAAWTTFAGGSLLAIALLTNMQPCYAGDCNCHVNGEWGHAINADDCIPCRNLERPESGMTEP